MIDTRSFLILRIVSLLVQSLLTLTVGVAATLLISILWALVFLYSFSAVPPEIAPPVQQEETAPAPVPEAIPEPDLPEREGRAPRRDAAPAGLV